MQVESLLSTWLGEPVKQLHHAKQTAAHARQAGLTKPPGSLGRLEEIAVRLAGMQGTERPRLEQVRIAVFASDHGVAEEGVSAFPQAVTLEMVRNFARGGAAISVLARELGATLEVINVGTVGDPGPLSGVVHQLAGGLRATMGYVGCATIEDMRKTPSFVKVSGAGQRESHVHDVQITKEPPNYRAG